MGSLFYLLISWWVELADAFSSFPLIWSMPSAVATYIEVWHAESQTENKVAYFIGCMQQPRFSWHVTWVILPCNIDRKYFGIFIKKLADIMMMSIRTNEFSTFTIIVMIPMVMANVIHWYSHKLRGKDFIRAT